jgi:cysteine synthase
MAQGEHLNVFSGPDSIARYFDPDNLPLLPMVEIPTKLNPFRSDNVRIYAKILTAHPAQNVKALPALNMLRHEPSAASKAIVEASSGSTVLSMGMAARALYGNEDVCAYVTNKKHPDQLRLLRFFGLKVALYGGLAQQEPHDPKGIMSRLRHRAKNDGNTCYLGQYDNDNNWKSHERWTGVQIYKQLPKINILCTTVGTGGCITGTGSYLKNQNPAVKVVGVCNVFGDPTPGPRHFPGFESSTFPWRETIDEFEDVASTDSYSTSMQLCREGIIAGPSSGEALYGLLKYLGKLRRAGTLSSLADEQTGEISCVFICCDLPYQYMDLYFEKLKEDQFPPIINKVRKNMALLEPTMELTVTTRSS